MSKYNGTAAAVHDLVRETEVHRDVYVDQEIFDLEMEHLFANTWVYVGHDSQVPNAGDYYGTTIGKQPVIMVRHTDGVVHVLYNRCPHKGTRITGETYGNAGKFFRCPYHAWSYNLDGSLRAARQMPAEFDRAAHGLKGINAVVVEGLIFVSFAEPPLELEHVAAALSGSARIYGWADAKVAHRETYVVNANWKLAVENYMECYHCGPAHEEYSRFHLYARPAALNREADARLRERTQALGVSIREVDHWGLNAMPGQEAADSLRSSLADSAVSGSEDGGPLAPLMGQFADFDGGVTFFDVGLTSNFLAYPDHGLIYRFVPRSVNRTDMEVIWLVRGDAHAGVDYDLERLTWLWKLTSMADKRIIELNQQGITSRYYEPGPYSPMEQHTAQLIAWLLAELR